MGSPSKKPARRSRYTEAERERGLVALALASGSERRASRALTKTGLAVPASTLQSWKRLFADEYAQVQTRVLPEIRRELAERHTELANQELDLARSAAEKLQKRVAKPDVDNKTLIDAMGKADIGSGIHTQRGSELRGEATTIIEHRSDTEILRKLKAMGIVIDGEATEIPPEQLHEGQDESPDPR